MRSGALVAVLQCAPVSGLEVERVAPILPLHEGAPQTTEVGVAPGIVARAVNTALVEVDQIDLAMAVDENVASIKVGMIHIVLMEATDELADSFPCLLRQGFLAQGFCQSAYGEEALHDELAPIACR